MSLDRTPPVSRSSTNNPIGEQSTVEPTIYIDPTPMNESSNCHICHEPLNEGQELLSLRQCSHTFHRNCIEDHLSSASECPSCKISSLLSDLRIVSLGPKPPAKTTYRGKGRGALSKHYNTRNSKKNLFQEQTNLLDVSADLQGAVGMTPTHQPRNTEPSQDNNRLVAPPNINSSIDYTEIQKMVESSLCSLLTRLNILPQPNSGNPNNIHVNGSNSTNNNTNRHHVPLQQQPQSQMQQSPALQPQPPVLPQSFQAPSQSQPRFSNSPNHFSVSTFPLQPDKITTIIQNWHLKFDGSPTGLTVDEFLYRVTTLTEDTFNGDFSLICKNLNILLSGKAREWYWRYRKNANPIIWEDFCDSIKFQYRDFKTSFDIREEIRNRKQRVGESFDSFFEAVTAIHDRLPTQMPELDLIEILTRNLRPEIRQELLYIPINSLAHLRKLVHMRENFLSDDYVKKQLSTKQSNTYPMRRQISEILDYNLESEDNSESINAMQGLTPDTRCWNCDEKGHYWENCLEARKVFCYGCGAKDIYKPNCVTCAEAKQKFHRNFRQGNLSKKTP